MLRGAAGDWKSQTGYRLYTGDEAQEVDPLIASAEAGEGTPAYRGIAYAMFEDFQLADFGNHIPSLTFEVEADEGPVALGGIAAELSGGAIGGATMTQVSGYAASGDSVRGAVETLTMMRPLSVVDDGITLRLIDEEPDSVALDATQLGAAADGKHGPRMTIDRQSAGTLPDEIAITYYEETRDYQAGLQRARRGGPGRRVEKIELPASLAVDEAKACAERRLATLWSERAQATINLPWRHLERRPGEALSIPGLPGSWRVKGWSLERMTTELRLAAMPATIAGTVASPGRAIGGDDEAHGPTVVELLDLPVVNDATAGAKLWIAASGPERGWRAAELTASLDSGASWTSIGRTAPAATIGSALDVLGIGSSTLIDRVSTVEVELLNDMMWLESRSDAALVAGGNLAMLGDELIQFGMVEQTGARRFRLSRMLRGRRGSEWAMAEHVVAERLVLIEAATLLPLDLSAAAIGSGVMLMAEGVGDGGVPVEASTTYQGRSLRPPAPIRLRGGRLADGTVRLAWTRRSRAGWSWIDGSDAPLGEEVENYRLTITPSVGLPRTVETSAAAYDYGGAEQAIDGAGGATSVAVSLVQLGSIAASLPPSTATFDI